MNKSPLKDIKNWPELAHEVKWSATTLAKRFGVSGETLRKHFLKQFGQTPKSWLATERHRQALKLLSDGSSIKQTASSLGYKQQTNFTRQFKGRFGICPSLQIAVEVDFSQNLRK